MTSIYPLLFPATFFLLLALERFLPGRPQPKIRFWILKGIVFFMIGGAINATVAPFVAAHTASVALFDLTSLGTIGGGLVGILVATFVGYWTHRAFHRIHFIWRWTHQMHHSAERVDVAGFSYGHPFELVFATSTAPIIAVLLGTTPEAAMLSGYLVFAHGLFTHLNVRTPQWLGNLVQRPEAHLVHHERGVHAYNYGLPLWDMVFGTFRSPAEFDAPLGFWDGASTKIGAMLIGRDVATPKA